MASRKQLSYANWSVANTRGARPKSGGRGNLNDNTNNKVAPALLGTAEGLAGTYEEIPTMETKSRTAFGTKLGPVSPANTAASRRGGHGSC